MNVWSSFIIMLLMVIGTHSALALPLHAPVVSQISDHGQVLNIDFDRNKLIVRPKSDKTTVDQIWSDPKGWVQSQQRKFFSKMSGALRKFLVKGDWSAAWLLIGLSFAYGIFHAAGPGHGKAVVSTWLVANEQQLRRGIIIAIMAAFIQALSAITIVSTLLFVFSLGGSMARSMARWLEAASYGLIALLGVYLVWQAVRMMRAMRQAQTHNHQHDTHQHDDHHHHDGDCGCDHSHMPDVKDLDQEWSLVKALSLSFAVGIRPCSGAILILLTAAPIGLYWVGIVATFAMAVGTAITVSVIAVLAVTSRDMALRLVGGNGVWMASIAIGLRFIGGLFIMALGALLFWASITNTLVMGS